jgi:hypothetical protein
LDAFRALADLSSLLYDTEEAYPVELYRAFRRVYESSRNVVTTLDSYEANSEHFEDEQKNIS